ncbi:MAG: hypothetical protein AB1896_18000 [Thermodesulfobacteriota bacterium]
MTELEATERVTKALFEAIYDVVGQIKEQKDEEALSKVGPVLITTGVMILVQGIGLEAAARVVRELAARIERGDFTRAGNLFGL